MELVAFIFNCWRCKERSYSLALLKLTKMASLDLCQPHKKCLITFLDPLTFNSFLLILPSSFITSTFLIFSGNPPKPLCRPVDTEVKGIKYGNGHAFLSVGPLACGVEPIYTGAEWVWVGMSVLVAHSIVGFNCVMIGCCCLVFRMGSEMSGFFSLFLVLFQSSATPSCLYYN